MTLSSADPDILRVTDRFVFFWKPPSPFGQWTPSAFTVDGVEYSCAEQLMMAEKARLFGDDMVRAQILAATSPREHKKLGRQVRGFQDDVWRRHREEIVYRGNMAKFGQDDALRAPRRDRRAHPRRGQPLRSHLGHRPQEHRPTR